MKASILALAATCCAILISCDAVTFPEPQPRGVPALLQMPPSTRGVYLNFLKDLDTAAIPGLWKQELIIIDPWGYYAQNSGVKSWKQRGVISDSVVVKFYQGYYFYNFIEDNRWCLILLKPTMTGSPKVSFVNLDGDEKENEIITRMSKVIEVKKDSVGWGSENETLGYSNYYEINPTRDQLMSLISMGFFTEFDLVRVNNKK